MDSKEWIKTIRDSGGQLGDFDKYDLSEEPIAHGGFSKVYLATRDGYEFAMKIPETINLEGEESIEIDVSAQSAFKEEMERWALVSNIFPNDVVCLLDYGYDPFPWMVMELAEDNLNNAIENGTASVSDLMSILDSLQNLHSIRIAHLDLKPDNILKIDGRWKLSDFGLSQFNNSDKIDTSIRGTPDYMAPEQVDNKSKRMLDSRTDIWQMGIILYKLITGHNPYGSSSLSDKVLAIRNGGPNISEIDGPYASVLKKALAKNIDTRYRTAGEMKTAMELVNEYKPTDNKNDLQQHGHLKEAISAFYGTEEKNLDKAYDLFSKDDSTLAKAFAAYMQFFGLGTNKDALSAMYEGAEVLPDLVEESKNDALALCLLGVFYSYGIGVDEDKNLAFSNIRKSAEKGNPMAQNILGVMYELGEGTEVDEKKALLWYSKSSKCGFVTATRNLAQMYYYGNDFVDADANKAIELYREAASKGDVASQSTLGIMLCVGKDVQQDLEKGIEMITKSWNQGYRDSKIFVSNDECISSNSYDSGDELRLVVLLDGVKEVGDSAFEDCDDLQIVSLPNTLKTIGAKAFYNTDIRSIHIPDSVTEIKTKAFENCSSLSSVAIGKGIKSIGTKVFRKALIGNLQLPDNVEEIGKSAFEYSGIKTISMPGVKTIGALAFESCNNLESVECGIKLNTIERNAFAYCHSMKTINLNGVRKIGYEAFRDCTELKSIELQNIEIIEDEAFAGCSHLSNVVIGNKIREIGLWPFNSTKITKIVVPTTFKTVDYIDYGVKIIHSNTQTTNKPEDKSTRPKSVNKPPLEVINPEEQYKKGMEWIEFNDPSSDKEAFICFRSAAKAGHARAQYMMGVMYKEERGVQKSFKEAANWFEKSAEQGYNPAQYEIAFMYEHGQGVPQSDMDAAKWYLSSAKQGNVSSGIQLGLMYLEGKGVTKSYSEAAKWFEMAAISGNARAQNHLADLYLAGKGVPQDYSKAMELYSLSSKQGFATATRNVGYLYENGLGVTKDYQQALNMYAESINRGYRDANQDMMRVKSKLNEMKHTNNPLSSNIPATTQETTKPEKPSSEPKKKGWFRR